MPAVMTLVRLNIIMICLVVTNCAISFGAENTLPEARLESVLPIVEEVPATGEEVPKRITDGNENQTELQPPAPPPIEEKKAGTAPADGNVAITADNMSHDQTEDVFHAMGNVVIVYGGITLTADEAAYDRRNGKMRASGNVKMIKEDSILYGSTAVIDLETGRGELDKGTYFVPSSHMSLIGKKMIRLNPSELLSNISELTTCDLPDPSWKFGASYFYYNRDSEYASGKNVVFYIKGMPVLYLPWMALPVARERKTGFLFPRFRLSNGGGPEIDVPFYWNIAPNQDALFDLDVQTKRGVGTGVEYRYYRNRDSTGSVAGFLIYDNELKAWRGMVAQNHTETFSPSSNLRFSINMNTKNFWSDFGEKSGDYNRQSSDTIVNYLKFWQHYALTANLQFSENLYTPNNSTTLQVLPEIGLAGVRQKIGNVPIYFDVDSSVSNLYRETGTSGQRLLAFPRLTLATGIPGYIHASLFSGLHVRGYRTSGIDSTATTTSTDSLTRSDSTKTMLGDLLPEIGARASTSLSRIYTINGKNLKKLRHELIPEISYTYRPDHDQSRLPFYDFSDRLVFQNIVYYSLTSSLSGKVEEGEDVEYREFSRIRLMQGYSFEGTRLDTLTSNDSNRHLTDVILETETWLHPKARLIVDARYNVYDARFSSISPGIDYDDAKGTYAGLSYRFSRNQVEYLEARVGTKIFMPWIVGYVSRYSLGSNTLLESIYTIEYRHQCWSIIFAWHNHLGSQSYTVNFSLAGKSVGGVSQSATPTSR